MKATESDRKRLNLQGLNVNRFQIYRFLLRGIKNNTGKLVRNKYKKKENDKKKILDTCKHIGKAGSK